MSLYAARTIGAVKVYGSGPTAVRALDGVDAEFEQGRFTAIMGPSGSGKSTLLHCLAGLDHLTSGTVMLGDIDLGTLDDRDLTVLRRERMGFVFQAFNLIPVFTSAENVELPLLLGGTPAGEARARAVETLERVGLGHRTGHRPNELSGGEQQRVTIARALAGRPRLVWADEPTGALDTETATQVMGLIRELNADGLTVILVTHDEGIGANAGRLLHMVDGSFVSDTAATPEASSPAPGV
jgi:putative ABC transport system ATP-binding protein